jgi:hypothetical protein
MSLYVVERPDGWGRSLEYLFGPMRLNFLPFAYAACDLRDCNEHDGEWPAFISLAHETVEWEGRAVPLFEGDVERIEWEARRRGVR